MSNIEHPISNGEKRDRVYDLEQRLIAFAVRVLEVAEALPKGRAGSHVAGQLVRCGTSPAPNYAEAQSAESRADFLHKMKVCLMALRDTRVWMRLIQAKQLIKSPERLDSLLVECEELIRIFATSIATAQGKRSSASPAPGPQEGPLH